jgi:hypothetical protein
MRRIIPLLILLAPLTADARITAGGMKKNALLKSP